MIKWYFEYTIGNTERTGDILRDFDTPCINYAQIDKVIKEIAKKESCPLQEVYIDNVARINSN